jgi:hypothetical protein
MRWYVAVNTFFVSACEFIYIKAISSRIQAMSIEGGGAAAQERRLSARIQSIPVRLLPGLSKGKSNSAKPPGSTGGNSASVALTAPGPSSFIREEGIPTSPPRDVPQSSPLLAGDGQHLPDFVIDAVRTSPKVIALQQSNKVSTLYLHSSNQL